MIEVVMRMLWMMVVRHGRWRRRRWLWLWLGHSSAAVPAQVVHGVEM